MELLEWKPHKSLGAKCKGTFVKSYSLFTMACRKCRRWVGCITNRQECYLAIGGVRVNSMVTCWLLCHMLGVRRVLDNPWVHDDCQGGLYCMVSRRVPDNLLVHDDYQGGLYRIVSIRVPDDTLVHDDCQGWLYHMVSSKVPDNP